MFPRLKTSEGRTYLQIVESRREGKKVRQRVIANLGRIDKLKEKGQIENLVVRLSRFSEKLHVITEYESGGIEARRVTRIGSDLIVGRIWRELGIERIIKELAGGGKHELPLERSVYLAVLSRLFFPGSDRKAIRIARDYQVPGKEEIELHHMYRAMEWLGGVRGKIEDELFSLNRNLFSSLSLAFFDTTTISFSGQGGKDLGRKGYSKDRRPNDNQVVVGVVLDQTGRPIASPVWPGNRTDVTTIVPLANSLKKRFGIEEVVIVADRGMVSKKNRDDLSELGFPYILGTRMRKEKKAMREVLSRAGRYKEVKDNLKVKEVIHRGKRYIVCINPEEVEKDKRTREAILSNLEGKLKSGAKQLIGNSGYRRYLNIDKESVTIDPAKVEQDKKYDGKWVLVTTSDLPADEVALRYKELWMVERIFREVKDILKTGPVYHRNDPNILGHLFVSFLSLLIMHELKNRIDFPAEWDEIRQDLDALYEVEVDSSGKTFLLRSPLQGISGKVFKAVGVAVPPSARVAQV